MAAFEKIRKRLTFPPIALFFLTWVLLSAVFMMDCVVIGRFSTFLFYLIPILIISINQGLRPSLWMSISATLLWAAAAMVSASRKVGIFELSWNTLMRGLLFFGVAFLIHYWYESNILAHSDAITGLSNRKAFIEALEHEIKRSNRYGHPISVAFIDLDDLKSANDTKGHKAGDRMIVDLARVIGGSIRGGVDVAARVGGDEFGILMPETDADQGKVVMERIRDRLKTVQHPKTGAALTISAGLATFANSIMSPDKLIQRADELMYQAKMSGKNCLKMGTFLG